MQQYKQATEDVMEGNWGALDLSAWERNLTRLVLLQDMLSEAKADLFILKKHENRLLATLKTSSPEKTDAAKLRDAYASEEYGEWLKGCGEAVRQESFIGSRVTAGELWFRMTQTQESSRRAEMQFQ